MSRSQEFLDALVVAREGVERKLAHHGHELEPEHLERIVQAHAEQLHSARQLSKWKEERGMAPTRT